MSSSSIGCRRPFALIVFALAACNPDGNAAPASRSTRLRVAGEPLVDDSVAAWDERLISAGFVGVDQPGAQLGASFAAAGEARVVGRGARRR